MAFNENLAARIRTALARKKGIEEKKMFGGIAFLLRNFPQLSEAQVGKLLGTTKDTIHKVRDRSHWNIGNINPKDPVTLGL